MATLKDLRARFEKIDLSKVFEESVSETKSVIIELVSSQIERGEDYKGNDIGIYKDLKYARRKQNMGSKAPEGIIDLKYTGDFLKRLYLKKYPRNYLIRSFDKKNSILLGTYGPRIFELNQENLDYYINIHLIPTILSKIK